jgi:hypothetical protein
VQLPPSINNARVLVTVKAYPKPSSKYEELVCTAGLLDGKDWIRIYPVSYRFLMNDHKYPKYSWISLDLVRKRADFRPESYSPKQGIDEYISVESELGTRDAWAARKSFVLHYVFTSMSDLIDLAHGAQKTSLATIKPTEFVGFDIVETDREWKEAWQDYAKQRSFSDLGNSGDASKREPVKKLPYDYFYRFLTEGDTSPRRLKIEDWEIGALYWNCLKRASGDEHLANEMVRAKYWDEFVNEKDLYLFVGTTLQYHRRKVANPFMIIGVFYPPMSDQPLLV